MPGMFSASYLSVVSQEFILPTWTLGFCWLERAHRGIEVQTCRGPRGMVVAGLYGDLGVHSQAGRETLEISTCV